MHKCYSPNNGIKNTNIYTKKISHTHAAECRYKFKIVHAQYYIMTNKQAI